MSKFHIKPYNILEKISLYQTIGTKKLSPSEACEITCYKDTKLRLKLYFATQHNYLYIMLKVLRKRNETE